MEEILPDWRVRRDESTYDMISTKNKILFPSVRPKIGGPNQMNPQNKNV